MDKKIILKRAFNGSAWIALALAFLCNVILTAGDVFKPLYTMLQHVAGIFQGNFSLRGLAALLIIIVIIVIWALSFAKNMLKGKYHYLPAIDLTVMGLALALLIDDRTTYVKNVQAGSKTTIIFLVLVLLFVILGLAAIVLDFICIHAENKAAKEELGQTEPENAAAPATAYDDTEVKNRLDALEKKQNEPAPAAAAAPADDKEVKDLQDRVEKLEKKAEDLQEGKEDKKKQPAAVAAVAVAPAEEEAAPVAETKGSLHIDRRPFKDKIVGADKTVRDNYNEIKNYLVNYYKAKSRISIAFDTFHIGMDTYVKIASNQRTLKVFFAIDPAKFKDSTIPVEDASKHKNTEMVPTLLKVKSGLSVRRAEGIIDQVMEAKGIKKKEIAKGKPAPADVDYIKEIKNEKK